MDSPQSIYCYKYTVFAPSGAVGIVQHCYDSPAARDTAFNNTASPVKEKFDKPLPTGLNATQQDAVNQWTLQHGKGYYLVVAQTDLGNWIIANYTLDPSQAQTILNLTYGQATINSTKTLVST